jgi:soluble lytic murein transglycosylase
VRIGIGHGRDWKCIGYGLAVLLILATSLSQVAQAGGFYRYIDAEGVVHFSDTPVDDRYKRQKRPARQEGLAITPRPRRRGPTERDYDRLIYQVASRHRVQPALVKAVIAAESNFKPNAVSRVGAQGLMQLMPATAAELGVERPFAVIDNMEGGARYLRLMLDRYGDVTRALAAYNAGPTAVDRYGGVPPYPETQAYVARVLEYYRGYWPEFDRSRKSRESGAGLKTPSGAQSATATATVTAARASERAGEVQAKPQSSATIAQHRLPPIGQTGLRLPGGR